MLLCTFASPRSSPEKIRLWIDYLQEQGERHRGDPEVGGVIDLLLAKAQGWEALRASELGQALPTGEMA